VDSLVAQFDDHERQVLTLGSIHRHKEGVRTFSDCS
jgi:hypothetical protein